LKQADVVVTNPPFSLFREYMTQLVEYDKRFIVIGNMNAVTYKEIFPLIAENRLSVLYVQLRMIAAIACLGGYDPKDDAVQTMVYLCLLGEVAAAVIKQAGIKIGNRLALNALKKLPGKVLTKINQKVGMRLLTKFGTKGVINLVKAVPVAGGIVGAGMDVVSTKAIAKQAVRMFIDNPYAPNADANDSDSVAVIDGSDEDVEPIDTTQEQYLKSD
jgi:uncharacterized protein (DUF697 family)